MKAAHRSVHRQHYSEPITLAKAAKIAGFAPTYFSTLFRRECGVTFEKHLSELRMARAKELLTDTSFNLRRIAELSGFSRATYLSRVFRARIGETPMEYRSRTLHEPARRRARSNGAHTKKVHSS